MGQPPVPPAKTFQRLTLRLSLPVYQRLEAVRRHEPREAFIKRAIVALLDAEEPS